jgi:hypothetical protein
MSSNVTELAITLASIFPEWKVLSDQYCALCQREEAIQAEINSLNREIERTSYANADPRKLVRITTTPPIKRISDAARRLLGSAAPPPEPPPALSVTTVSYDDARVQRQHDLSAELEAVREAKPVLLQQLERAHAEGSRRLCEALAPEYTAIVKQLADAVIALGNAALMHELFLCEHREALLGFLRPPAIELVADDPRQTDSRIRRFLRSAAEAGYFNLAQVPDAWRLKHAEQAPTKAKRGLRRLLAGADEAPGVAGG